MSEASRDLDVSAEQEKVGPDYFAFYTHEVEELLSQPRTNGVVGLKDGSRRYCNGKETGLIGSLFTNCMSSSLSDSNLERLNVLLRQSVVAFSNEVDEMLDPVLAVHQIQSHLRHKKALSHCSPVASKDVKEQPPCKKIKLSSSSTSRNNHLHASSSESSRDECNTDGKPNGVKKVCCHCGKIKDPMWRTGLEGTECLCNDCGVKFEQGRGNSLKKDQNKGSSVAPNPTIDDDDKNVDDYLQFILENDVVKVEQSVKEHSEELSMTLGQMEHWLEELLDTITSSCRLMTLAEKQQLLKLIQKLPPRNLDRVVEIIKRKPAGKHSSDEIFIDLEKEDNVTLWRLYYYVQAVENARKFAGAGTSEEAS